MYCYIDAQRAVCSPPATTIPPTEAHGRVQTMHRTS
jgi:hypothetical protein